MRDPEACSRVGTLFGVGEACPGISQHHTGPHLANEPEGSVQAPLVRILPDLVVQPA